MFFYKNEKHLMNNLEKICYDKNVYKAMGRNLKKRYFEIFKTVSSPSFPVNALALPEFTKIALTTGSLYLVRFFLHWFTEALEFEDWVKTPAIADFFLSSIKRRSSSLFCVFLMPEYMVEIFMFFNR